MFLSTSAVSSYMSLLNLSYLFLLIGYWLFTYVMIYSPKFSITRNSFVDRANLGNVGYTNH